MNSSVTFLLTMLVTEGMRLVQVALWVEDRNMLAGDIDDAPMEPENRQALFEMLPSSLRLGTIVAVDTITAVAYHHNARPRMIDE